MGQTMVEKIVSRQVGRKVAAGEKIARLPITKLFFNDVIGPPAIEGFRANFTEVFAQQGTAPQVFDPQRLDRLTLLGIPCAGVVDQHLLHRPGYGPEEGLSAADHGIPEDGS